MITTIITISMICSEANINKTDHQTNHINLPVNVMHTKSNSANVSVNVNVIKQKSSNKVSLLYIDNIYAYYQKLFIGCKKKIDPKIHEFQINNKKYRFMYLEIISLYTYFDLPTCIQLLRWAQILGLHYSTNIIILQDINNQNIVYFGNINQGIYLHINKDIKSYYLKSGQEVPHRMLSINNECPIGEGYFVNSPFGMRRSPIHGRRAFHPGIDIIKLSNRNYPVFALEDGIVIAACRRKDYGNMVIIDHGGGYTTLYGHLSRITVTKGQKVTKGTMLGNIGMTGLTTGPHLHLEIRYKEVRIDPLKGYKFYIKSSKQTPTDFYKTRAFIHQILKQTLNSIELS